MSIFQNAVVTVKRAGVAVVGIPPIPVQVDLMSAAESSYYGGDEPYFRYDIYTQGVYDIRQDDLLTDTVNIDTKTGTNKRYRVINDPDTEQFISHLEIVADRYRGS